MLEYSSIRYLIAKVSVDDRALNQRVLGAFKASLQRLEPERKRVLEIGAGVGTMLSRLEDWGVLSHGDFTLLDSDHPSLEAARAHLVEWSGAPGVEQYPSGKHSGSADDVLWVGRGASRSRVRFEHAEAFAFLNAPEHAGSFDVVMANAVLDLMDLTPALESIWRVLSPGGLFWFTINFDGETMFLPELELDASVMRLYHLTMDERVRDGRPAGHSKTGRQLLTCIPSSGAKLEAAGSSDWVVFPKDGRYPGDEAYFLHHIVNTVDEALSQNPALDQRQFQAWVAERHRQVEAGELCYIAHQLDVFGRLPEVTRAKSNG